MTTIDWTAIRGPLPERRMNARSTAALLDNPGCVRRAVLDTARVNTERLAAALGQPIPFGQSPFALGQGNRFEQRVKADGYAELVRVLAELGVELPAELSTAKVKGFDNEARVARTREVLQAIATGEPDAPNVIDHGMTKLMVGEHPVYLEQDAMAFRHGGRLHICEVKGFPLVDGTAQPDKVGAAARPKRRLPGLPARHPDRTRARPRRDQPSGRADLPQELHHLPHCPSDRRDPGTTGPPPPTRPAGRD